ncbi:MAG: hypothetical protein EXS36_01525 [Pedosphaera sp.]|nr:hypothetical protein [Pedosphaera sp.]
MHQDGFVYFSDPDFKQRKRGAVYRFVRGGVPEALPGELVLPNGVEISADGKLLVVSDSATKRWYAYDFKPGLASPEQAWAMTQAQLAWYREMETCGELVQIRDRKQLDAHLERWLDQPSSNPKPETRNSKPKTRNSGRRLRH